MSVFITVHSEAGGACGELRLYTSQVQMEGIKIPLSGKAPLKTSSYLFGEYSGFCCISWEQLVSKRFGKLGRATANPLLHPKVQKNPTVIRL